MKKWLRHAVEADPTAPDEWLNRATAVAVILALGAALYSQGARGPNHPIATLDWGRSRLATTATPDIARPLAEP